MNDVANSMPGVADLKTAQLYWTPIPFAIVASEIPCSRLSHSPIRPEPALRLKRFPEFPMCNPPAAEQD